MSRILMFKFLVTFVIKPTEMDCQVRCFSHLASHPSEVKQWVPVTMKQLGDTIVFDQRSCEEMNGMDVGFLLDKTIKSIKGITISASLTHLETNDNENE